MSRQKLLAEFSNVLALYSYFRSQPHKVQQARFRGDEIEATGLDFICDVEIKAKRALSPVEYGLFLRMAQNEKMHRMISEPIKLKLAEAWLGGELGTDGQYRKLFFLAKRAHDLGSVRSRAPSTVRDELDELDFPDVTHSLAGDLTDEQVSAVFDSTAPNYFADEALTQTTTHNN